MLESPGPSSHSNWVNEVAVEQDYESTTTVQETIELRPENNAHDDLTRNPCQEVNTSGSSADNRAKVLTIDRNVLGQVQNLLKYRGQFMPCPRTPFIEATFGKVLGHQIPGSNFKEMFFNFLSKCENGKKYGHLFKDEEREVYCHEFEQCVHLMRDFLMAHAIEKLRLIYIQQQGGNIISNMEKTTRIFVHYKKLARILIEGDYKSHVFSTNPTWSFRESFNTDFYRKLMPRLIREINNSTISCIQKLKESTKEELDMIHPEDMGLLVLKALSYFINNRSNKSRFLDFVDKFIIIRSDNTVTQEALTELGKSDGIFTIRTGNTTSYNYVVYAYGQIFELGDNQRIATAIKLQIMLYGIINPVLNPEVAGLVNFFRYMLGEEGPNSFDQAVKKRKYNAQKPQRNSSGTSNEVEPEEQDNYDSLAHVRDLTIWPTVKLHFDRWMAT
uniref:Uncharacterized protein n=1 Tax=Acrobeloides nanus TaxID=290746 RepID=A0A914E3F0_9BILA